MLNKLWSLTWYAHIGASLLDPRFSIAYIGRYTKRAVMAEYPIPRGGIWECHDCHEGVVIPCIYINIYGETVKIDPKSLDPNTEVMRF